MSLAFGRFSFNSFNQDEMLYHSWVLHSCIIMHLLIQVKAWLAEKDAEALRCQKLLVEEEEAAQKR